MSGVRLQRALSGVELRLLLHLAKKWKREIAEKELHARKESFLCEVCSGSTNSSSSGSKPPRRRSSTPLAAGGVSGSVATEFKGLGFRV